ncbi:MAG: hypothetical protein M1818_003654 [Claussenomyces sp. TS43310]|nr:MAG: hypothetical protein M1818_003654 [Claussenomyces sp. TS43310]
MAPPHRSSHLPQLGSSGSTRDLYTSATPQLRRPDLSSRSPSAVGNLRAIPLSPSSSSGFMSPANNMESQMANATPPLGGTEVLSPLQTSDGQQIRPDIHAKIDKGFFLEGEWTCYRRNYFSLSCSYAITPHPPMATVHLQHNGSTLQVYAFAMSIAAVVDGRDGKPIELVQHTPKRDKGPQNQPDRVTLAPRPPLTMYSNVSEGGLGTASRAVFDGSYPPGTPNQPQTETTFERIQFKQATANNGKRRAAQQYYHLLVELYADVGPQMGAGRWIKIAQRVSCQIVVRGRSPGHYQSERRGSNTSAGPSGSGGKGAGPGSYSSGGNFGRSSGDQSGLSGSMLPGGGYGGGYDVRSHPYLPTSSCMTQMGNPLSPLLSGDEIKQIEEPAGYTYNPYTLYENANGMRLPTATPNYREERAQSYYQLPSLPSHMPSPKIKQEHFSLPALPSGAPNCGRWEGVSVSRGYIPSTFSRNEVNTS